MKDEIENTVSRNRVTRAPYPDQVTKGSEKHTSKMDNDQQGQKIPGSVTNRQYTVHYNVQYFEIPAKARYFKRWDGYSKDDDTIKPAESIALHCRDAYSRRLHKWQSIEGKTRKYPNLRWRRVQSKHQT